MSYLRGVFALVFVAVVFAAEEDFQMGDSEVKITAESGMMEFRRHRQEAANERRPVQIRMAQVVQLDKDGNEVTNCSDTEEPMTRRRRRDVKPAGMGQQGSRSGSGGSGGHQGSGSGNGSMGGQQGSGSGNGSMGGQQGSGSRSGGSGGQQGSGSGSGGMGDHQGSGSGNGRMPGSGDHGSTGGTGHWKRPHRSWMGMNGTGVGRRFSNFNQTKFTVEKKKDQVKLKHSRTLKAVVKRFHASLGEGVGKMAIDMALPENDGEIEIDGEKQKLRRGDLKFNIELSEWSWCGEKGDDGAAAFLDVYVEINSTRRPTMRRQRTASAPASFDLGDNTTMSFSGKVRVDDFLFLLLSLSLPLSLSPPPPPSLSPPTSLSPSPSLSLSLSLSR